MEKNNTYEANEVGFYSKLASFMSNGWREMRLGRGAKGKHEEGADGCSSPTPCISHVSLDWLLNLFKAPIFQLQTENNKDNIKRLCCVDEMKSWA